LGFLSSSVVVSLDGYRGGGWSCSVEKGERWERQ